MKRSGISKRATSHSFATHLFEPGYNIRTVLGLLGHEDVNAAMIYTHALNKRSQGFKSPLDP